MDDGLDLGPQAEAEALAARDGHIVFVGIPSQNMVQTIEQEIAPYLAV